MDLTYNPFQELLFLGYVGMLTTIKEQLVLEKREDEKLLHPDIIYFGVLLKKAKAPVAKAKHVRDSYKNSYIAPELVDGTGKPSI